MIRMSSITVQVALVLALFTTYSLAQAVPDNTDAGGKCQNSFPNSGLALLSKVYERVSNLEMEIKNTKERLDSCACGGGGNGRCLGNPCENGATCTEDTDTDWYNCACAEGWEGTHCEWKSYYRCLSNPCQSQSTCIESTDTDGYSCYCSGAYTGKDCETYAGCLNELCVNGATCIEATDTDRLRCVCSEGWEGRDCSVKINGRCLSNPCENGGRCVDFPHSDGYECKCYPYYLGTHCEIPV